MEKAHSLFASSLNQKAVANLIIFILHLEKSISVLFTASCTSQGENSLIVLTGSLSLQILTLFMSLHLLRASEVNDRYISWASPMAI